MWGSKKQLAMVWRTTKNVSKKKPQYEPKRKAQTSEIKSDII